jgi:hypothetical protein
MKHIAAWGLLVSTLTLLTGCDWVTASGPESVRIRVEGEVRTVELIVSKRFLVSRSLDGWQLSTVLDADTIQASLPFEQTYDISRDQRFLALVPNLQESDQLRVRGWVDGDQRYEQSSASLSADSTLQILYVFGNGGSVDGGGRI